MAKYLVKFEIETVVNVPDVNVGDINEEVYGENDCPIIGDDEFSDIADAAIDSVQDMEDCIVSITKVSEEDDDDEDDEMHIKAEIESWFWDHTSSDDYDSERDRIEDLTAMAEGANDNMVYDCIACLGLDEDEIGVYDMVVDVLSELAAEEI